MGWFQRFEIKRAISRLNSENVEVRQRAMRKLANLASNIRNVSGFGLDIDLIIQTAHNPAEDPIVRNWANQALGSLAKKTGAVKKAMRDLDMENEHSKASLPNVVKVCLNCNKVIQEPSSREMSKYAAYHQNRCFICSSPLAEEGSLEKPNTNEV